ncbi:MAG: PIN domain-containing protein [Candidatus Coatesbacteria bacterium]
MYGVLADTGPLVALLNRNDDFHSACKDEFRRIADPLLTVWPVITEVMHLLPARSAGRDALWEMMAVGVLRVVALDDGDMPRMREIMRKYDDQDVDLADAALVRVAEREGLERIFTLDRDFTVYRIGRTGRFSIMPAV